MCLFQLSCQTEVGSVGRKTFLFFFIFAKQLWALDAFGLEFEPLVLNTLLFVQTLGKFLCKYTWTRHFPPAFPRYHKSFYDRGKVGSGGFYNQCCKGILVYNNNDFKHLIIKTIILKTSPYCPRPVERGITPEGMDGYKLKLTWTALCSYQIHLPNFKSISFKKNDRHRKDR